MSYDKITGMNQTAPHGNCKYSKIIHKDHKDHRQWKASKPLAQEHAFFFCQFNKSLIIMLKLLQKLLLFKVRSTIGFIKPIT